MGLAAFLAPVLIPHHYFASHYAAFAVRASKRVGGVAALFGPVTALVMGRVTNVGITIGSATVFAKLRGLIKVINAAPIASKHQ